MWWTCEKVKNYWTQVWDVAKEITQQKLDIKPEMALLNVISGINDNKSKHCLIYIYSKQLGYSGPKNGKPKRFQ